MNDTASQSLGDRHHPIRTTAQDSLRREGFVHHIMTALVDAETKQATGYVVGLAGPWGSGKSSLLNLLQESLRARFDKELVLLRFNPWLVSGRDDLIRTFLLDFARALPAEADGPGKTVRDRMRDFAGRVAPFAEPAATLVGVPGGSAIKNGLLRLAGGEESLSDTKDKLSRALRGLRRPVIVLVDELDRAEPAEIKLMAQLVRAIADFPNVSYLLAYDRVPVHTALGEGDIARGRAYLEKIVSLEFDLPPPGEEWLVNALKKRIHTNAPDANETRLDRLFRILVPRVISQPRDLHRLLDAFDVQWRMTEGEIDAADLLAVAALKVKSPDVWGSFLRDWPSLLPGQVHEVAFRAERADNQKVWNSWLEEAGGTNSAVNEIFDFAFRRDTAEAMDGLPAHGRLRDRLPFRILLRLERFAEVPTRAEVVSLLRSDHATATRTLESWWQDGRFSDLAFRIEAIAPRDDGPQLDFWKALADFLLSMNGTSDPPQRLSIAVAIRSFGSIIDTAYPTTGFDSFRPNLVRALLEHREVEIMGGAIYLLMAANGCAPCFHRDPDRAWCDKTAALPLIESYARYLEPLLQDRARLTSFLSAGPLLVAHARGLLGEGSVWRQLCTNPTAEEAGRLLLLFYGGDSISEGCFITDLFGFDGFDRVLAVTRGAVSPAILNARAKAIEAMKSQPPQA